MRSRKILAACAGAILSAASPASTASLLDKMDGRWSGSGNYSDKAGAPMERVTCRLDTLVTAQGTQAKGAGRCATVSGTASVSMTITRKPDGRYNARFSSRASSEPLEHSGSEAGGAIVFRGVSLIRVDGKRYRSRVVLSFDGMNRFSITQALTPVSGGARRPVFDMRFARRGEP
jgi:hypothetical protein